ncbi:MAG: hypothetical protein Q8N03_09475 [Ignavibacteria bacterium]|nr:hypothetical protein [Ignavibacteria bacterium]
MDNLFDIIIGLVILYGLLSPFLKKKKQQQELPPYEAPPDSMDDSGNVSYKTKTEKGSGEYDILKEIEGLFNQTKVAQKRKQEEDSWIPTAARPQKYEGEHAQPVEPENFRMEDFKYAPVKKTYSEEMGYKYKSPVKLKTKAHKFEPVAVVLKSKFESEKLKSLRATLKNSNTFRDAFLISEILNKPKALRRK